jgi:hypothetical protein
MDAEQFNLWQSWYFEDLECITNYPETATSETIERIFGYYLFLNEYHYESLIKYAKDD